MTTCSMVVTNQNHVFVTAKSETARQTAQPVFCLWNREQSLSDFMKTQESIKFYLL